MYSLPKHGDKDPTPVVSLFYFVFFGMMVADIGYGLFALLGTSLALHFLHVSRDWLRICDSSACWVWQSSSGDWFMALSLALNCPSL